MRCEYCNSKHVKIDSFVKRFNSRIKNRNADLMYYIVCVNCQNVLVTPPDYLPEEQHLEYLERKIKEK